ncbi:MAG: PilZ domain-containing protein [Candidatus Auribacterota bacterium]
MNNKNVCTMLFVCLLCCAFIARADEIILKNGVRLQGLLVGERDSNLEFDILYDTIRIPARISKSDVLSVEMDNTGSEQTVDLFSISQQAKGLVLYEGRWLPKEHVDMVRSKQSKIAQAKKITLFSLQFFFFLMACLALVIVFDFLHYEWKRLRVRRVEKGQSGADYRLHRRISAAIPFEFEMENGTKHSAVTTNISLGGMLFTTPVALELTTQINVSLTADDIHIDCQGMVVRSDKEPNENIYNIGLSFIGLNADMRQKIARFIAHAQIQL